MGRPPTASAARSLVCPACGRGGLHSFGRMSARCDSCGCFIGGSTLETLRQISSLPESLGPHACECGHPEMRLLPDGVFHCPACGAEVLPTKDGKRGQTLNFHYESAVCGGEPCPGHPPVPDSPRR